MVAPHQLSSVFSDNIADPVDVGRICEAIRVPRGVYAPQEDSALLLGALAEHELAAGKRVLDLCSGSGVHGIGAALLGAEEVNCYDISALAVACALDNARSLGARIDARQGSLSEALARGPHDVVVSNPPYVPDATAMSEDAGLMRAWHGGQDGRSLLDPLCEAASDLLSDNGTLLLVQSEFADTDRSLSMLRSRGLCADVVARQTIGFGPVMMAKARWFEDSGIITPGRRVEELCVIRADKAAGAA